MKGARAAAAVAATVLAAAGCSERQAPAADDRQLTLGPPSVAAVPQLDLLDGKVLPIEAYKLTPERMRQINAAQARLANRCLARFGFPASVKAPGVTGASASSISRRYGITDAAAAARFGYHSPAGSDSRDARGSEAPQSPELGLVLRGGQPGTADAAHDGKPVPAGGCLGESRRALGETYERVSDEGLVDDIESAAGKQADADPRVTVKIVEWSACMKRQGYQFDGPFDPVESDVLKSSLAQPTPSSMEVQIAVADVACKRTVNLMGVWFTVESAYERVLIERKQERLADIKRELDAMLRAATAVRP